MAYGELAVQALERLDSCEKEARRVQAGSSWNSVEGRDRAGLYEPVLPAARTSFACVPGVSRVRIQSVTVAITSRNTGNRGNLNS